MRRMIGVLIALALSAGVFALWPRSESDSPPITAAAGTTTTTTTAGPTTTPSVSVDTTTTPTTEASSHVVETVEEAEAILRELWFGWFEGIYNQDEDRIREVVANPSQVEAAIAQFGVMEFAAEPTPDAIVLRDIEILKTDEECLAIWANVDAYFRDGSISGVHVFRQQGLRWLLINTWSLRDDLWEGDCEVVLGMP